MFYWIHVRLIWWPARDLKFTIMLLEPLPEDSIRMTCCIILLVNVITHRKYYCLEWALLDCDDVQVALRSQGHMRITGPNMLHKNIFHTLV